MSAESKAIFSAHDIVFTIPCAITPACFFQPSWGVYVVWGQHNN